MDRCKALNRTASWVCREAIAQYLAAPVDTVGSTPPSVKPKGSPHLVSFGFAFDPQMRKELDTRAKRIGRSVSWVCREALSRYLSTPLDKAARRSPPALYGEQR